jgi:hypothetical protein
VAGCPRHPERVSEPRRCALALSQQRMAMEPCSCCSHCRVYCQAVPSERIGGSSGITMARVFTEF